MSETELLKIFGAFFAIMNPFVNLPIFLSLTEGYSVSEQRKLSINIALFSAIMCLVILFAGQQIIGFFGVTIDQFRVAGGAVLAHIAWSMLNGNEVASHHGSSQEKDHLSNLKALAFYPITFPMIVGPGTIASIIIYAGHAKGLNELMSVGLVIGVVLGILFLVLFFAALFSKVLTSTMRVIMTRIMGMILLAIAVEMLFAGIKALLPALA